METDGPQAGENLVFQRNSVGEPVGRRLGRIWYSKGIPLAENYEYVWTVGRRPAAGRNFAFQTNYGYLATGGTQAGKNLVFHRNSVGGKK